MMRIELITVGNELITGMIPDTNSGWLASQFNLLGVPPVRISSVADSGSEIIGILEEAERRADIIVVTGGLGPTSDDVTKPALCHFFNTRLVFRQNVFNHIESILTKRGCTINENNRRQADLPESATILENDEGTAPGLWFVKNDKIFISLPGVPFEMKSITINKVIPKLKELFSFPSIFYRTVVTQGSFEAHLAEKLKDFESGLPGNMRLAYLPSPGIIRLRLSISGEHLANLEDILKSQIEKLQDIIPEYIVGYDDETLELIVGKLLKSRKISFSVAESCTGGTIASLITSVPGSSEYFKGGIVAYSNEVKKDQLAVEPVLIEQYGAVSSQVAEAMAINTRLLFNTDYALAVSGIAGPSGGSAEKPAGTVFIAVSGKLSTHSSRFSFGDNRTRNIQRASVAALNMLRKHILGPK